MTEAASAAAPGNIGSEDACAVDSRAEDTDPDRVAGGGPVQVPDLARIARHVPLGFECRSCGAAVYNHYIRIHHLLTTGEPCCANMREWISQAADAPAQAGQLPETSETGRHPCGSATVAEPGKAHGKQQATADMASDSELLVYTDGACKGNPGPAAIAWALIGPVPGGHISGHEAQCGETGGQGGRKADPANGILAEGSRFIGVSTNQVAEIVAATEGLDNLPPGSRVRLRTDSLYVVNTMMEGWRRKANKQYWSDLDRAVSRHREVVFEHVRGHHGEEWNEYVDQCASAACRP